MGYDDLVRAFVAVGLSEQNARLVAVGLVLLVATGIAVGAIAAILKNGARLVAFSRSRLRFLGPAWAILRGAVGIGWAPIERFGRRAGPFLPTIKAPERSAAKSLREWRDRRWPRPEPPEGSPEAIRLRKLKRRVLNLSHDITIWHEKQSQFDQTETFNAMPSPPWASISINWERTRLSDTMAEYKNQFDYMVELTRESLAKAGYTDSELDRHYVEPTHLDGVRIIYERLAALADRLPD